MLVRRVSGRLLGYTTYMCITDSLYPMTSLYDVHPSEYLLTKESSGHECPTLKIDYIRMVTITYVACSVMNKWVKLHVTDF